MVCVVIVALGFSSLLVYRNYLTNKIQDIFTNGPSQIYSREEIEPIAPYNDDEIKYINQMDKYNKEDTWVFYMYICGSNLESNEISELSSLTEYLLSEPSNEISENKKATNRQRVDTYLSEIQSQGMDMPENMYLSQTPHVYLNNSSSQDLTLTKGAASSDLEEITSVQLPENVKFVIQTGGSSRWSYEMVNPNRSQIFVYDSTGIQEVESNSIKNMGDQQTLTDFLQYCNTNYPADHQGLIFWNHGGGISGFCNDENYAYDNITFDEMKYALSQTFEATDSEDPALEFVGFDCCLMGTMELANALNGYAKYLIASEELEPGQGWDYQRWLSKFVKDTSINGAQLGRLIADTYVDFYASEQLEIGLNLISFDTTMSVIDVKKAVQANTNYETLVEKIFENALKDPKTLSTLSSASQEAIRYGGSSYATLNMLDLGDFMEALEKDYPSQATQMGSLIDDCVLYHRTSLSMADSKGISMYFPVEIKDVYGLVYFLEYLETVCDNDDIKALYYYKIGGCLSEDLQKYVEDKGYGEVPVLDTSSLRNISKLDPKIKKNGNYSIKLQDTMSDYVQSYTFTISSFDEVNEEVTYYGEDTQVNVDSKGKLVTDFDGTWISLEGHTLHTEVISSTDAFVKYRTPVLINGTNAYLILQRNVSDDSVDIVGVSKVSDESYDDFVGRSEIALQEGDKITPLYESSTIDAMETFDDTTAKGDSFTYHSNSEVKFDALEDGTYLSYVTVKDVRGNEFYSKVIEFNIRNGSIKDTQVRDDLYNKQS